MYNREWGGGREHFLDFISGDLMLFFFFSLHFFIRRTDPGQRRVGRAGVSSSSTTRVWLLTFSSKFPKEDMGETRNTVG